MVSVTDLKEEAQHQILDISAPITPLFQIKKCT